MDQQSITIPKVQLSVLYPIIVAVAAYISTKNTIDSSEYLPITYDDLKKRMM
ncbi:MAG TPA: hypothetical protein VE445_10270 [Nitrososphaeraceae archaeon]|nr:hypothetical protein [Nitrososphaeraceae archaeon]